MTYLNELLEREAPSEEINAYLTKHYGPKTGHSAYWFLVSVRAPIDEQYPNEIWNRQVTVMCPVIEPYIELAEKYGYKPKAIRETRRAMYEKAALKPPDIEYLRGKIVPAGERVSAEYAQTLPTKIGMDGVV